MATVKYMLNGGDGFDIFKKESDDKQLVVDDENGLWLTDVIKQFSKRTEREYEIIPHRELARLMRLRLFNADPDS